MRIDQIESNEITGSVTVSGSLNVTGSVGTTAGLTGSLFGTASLAQTASYVLNAVSSSFATTASFAVSSSRAVTSSFAITASFATTASFALNAGSGGGGSRPWGSFISTFGQTIGPSNTEIRWETLASNGGITQPQFSNTAAIRVPSGSWVVHAAFYATNFSDTTGGQGQIGVYRSGSLASLGGNGLGRTAYLAPTTNTTANAPKPVINQILYVTASTDMVFVGLSNVGSYTLGAAELTITSV